MNDYISFFREIQARSKFEMEYEKRHSNKLASKFNAMKFLNWNENKVSEIIAFFLDPNEDHGQGDIYLKLFKEELGLYFPYDTPKKVQVILEDSTFENRRVDIVLRNQDQSSVLGIENKIYPWTKDQENQVEDYLKYLQYISNNHYQLLYLTPKSKELTEYSGGKEIERLIETGKLYLINYEEHIIPLLKEFIKNTENERVRCFLVDFESQLIENYMGKENLDLGSLNHFITETEENIETAFKVSNTLNSIKQEMKNLVDQQMYQLVDELTEELKMRIIYNEQFHHFEIPVFKNFFIKFNYEEGGVIYGLVKTPQYMDSHYDKVYLNDLRNYLGVKFRTSHWWPLFFLQYHNIEHDAAFWIDVKNGTFKEFMKSFIITVLQSPNELKQDL
ncbi:MULTISPECIES: PD-(D/E)XK nuclease family protein [Chryseobacterium]|uniref:PDDEXK-like family protein n=1 Tax=Chryseobacterium TaxID=59732 RepID=UPI001F4A6A93|nr:MULTISPECIES: PD-(D/E)XK nuclease family protein [Chryseobacterium]WFB69349.1 PD-(D/E)XK nuclease family protein [Chryseobacterium sp. WX]